MASGSQGGANITKDIYWGNLPQAAVPKLKNTIIGNWPATR